MPRIELKPCPQVAVAVLALLVCGPGLAPTASAQYASQGGFRFAQERVDPDNKAKWQVQWTGLMDLRLVATGTERNWNVPDSSSIGGRGLSRYGGARRGTKAVSLKVPQISLVSDVLYKSEHRLHIQLNYNDANDEENRNGRFGLIEGYYVYHKDYSNAHSLEIRAGEMIPPISLEHPGAAWSTKYTITPSAINTWVGEELRAATLEIANIWRLSSSEINFGVAGFSGNDPAGTILAWRGWALHDYVPTLGSRLRLAKVLPVGLSPLQSTDPFNENDGKIGIYSYLSYNYMDKSFLSFFFSDNNANIESKQLLTIDYAWKNRFFNISFKQLFFSHLELLAQYLKGETQMAYLPSGDIMVDNDFTAWYALLNFTFGKNSLSIRYDDFRVKDIDVNLVDDNNQKGRAQTVAYFYRLNGMQRLGLEYLHIKSQRSGNENFGNGDPSDDLFQINYRLTF